MSQPWKFLPLAAIVAVLGALLLAPGGAARPETAFAVFDCNVRHQLNIEIRDIDSGSNPVSQAGIVVRISPDPLAAGGGGNRNYVDNGNNDDSNVVGRIREQEACEANNTAPSSMYTAEIVDFPDNFECDIVHGTQTFSLTASNTGDPVELFVENCSTPATATPTGTLTVTVTPTGTPGAAATVTTSASPATIGCTGTSIVSISVRDAAGSPVPAGTAVTITTTLGSVSPSSGQTTDGSGNAFTFLTGEGQGGTATVTAKSGNAEGSSTVTINCGAAATATSAPPPTVAPGGGGGVISPPNTGSAGLADSGSAAWMTFAGLAFLLAATLGAVGIVRVRA